MDGNKLWASPEESQPLTSRSVGRLLDGSRYGETQIDSSCHWLSRHHRDVVIH